VLSDPAHDNVDTEPSSGEIDPGAPLALHLFGGLRICCGDRDLAEQLPGRQGRAFVAYLVLNRDRPVGRDELLNVLWPSHPPAAPEAALSSVLAKVRRALEPGLISGRQALTLQLPPASEIDVETVQSRVERAERALAERGVVAALETVQGVLDVLAQPLLPDLAGNWVEAWRQRLDDLTPRALEVGAKAGVALGDSHLPVAERLAGALVAREPFREAGYALLMEAQARQGNVAEALRTFDQVRVFLRDELGASPSPSLVALHERLLRDDPAPPFATGTGATIMPTVTSQLIDGAFVGRDELSERLRTRWEECRGGPTRLVLLVGDAGVGKSRLAAEFAADVHDAGAIVLYGRADEDALLPHQPFVEALGHLIAHGDPALVAAAEQDRDVLCRLLPDLAPLSAAPAPPRDGDDTLRYRLFEAVASLLRTASARAPVLLILDDLHWADKPSLLLLRHLLRHQKLENVLIVGTFRRVEVGLDHPLLALLSDLRRERRYDRLTVAGLDEDATRALVADRLGRPVTAKFIRRLCRQTEGNAFFIEETIRALVESGLPADDPISDVDLERIGVPEGVSEIVGRRVSNLSELAAETLAAAAVVGRQFRLALVAQLVGVAPERVVGALEESMEAGLVREDADRVDRFAFSNALVRAVLYDRISASRRVRLHHGVAEALEALARRDAVNPAELAHHFLMARHVAGPDPARRYTIAAGDRATELLAYEEAIEHYAQAATLCGDDDETRCEVLLALGRAQWRAGRDEARGTFCSAAESATRRGDAEQLARAALGHSARYHESGYAGARHELLEQALEAIGGGDSPHRVLLLSRLAGSVSFASGQRDRAADASAEALAIARRLGDESLLLAGLMARHATLLHVRDLDERLRISEELMAIGVEHRELEAERRHWRIYDLLESADVDGARREHRGLQELATNLRQPQWQSIAAGWRGVLAELDGDVELAERCAEECLALGHRAHMRDARSTWTAKLLLLRRRQGRLQELEPLVEQLVTRDDVRKTGWYSAHGLILAARGDRERAGAIYGEELRTFDMALPAFWLTNLAMLSDLCAAMQDAEGARALYDALVPHASRAIVVSYSSCWGPVDGTLALLAGVFGDDDARRRHVQAALARAQRMHAPLFVSELEAL
jgi:DNA-binding SARP family transcriptional activator/tetratricopeptide (TPR) repeat protein